MLGLLGTTGHLALPPDLVLLQDPMVIFVAGAMYLIEFFADKIPGIDTGWDVIHTFIRIPAGAILAAALAGGTLAAGAHATKAGTRAIINASPEPITNWTASILEDVAVIGGLWTALQNPVLFLVGLAAFFALAIWLLPKIWRGLQRIFGYLKRKLGGAPEIPEDVATD